MKATNQNVIGKEDLDRSLRLLDSAFNSTGEPLIKRKRTRKDKPFEDTFRFGDESPVLKSDSRISKTRHLDVMDSSMCFSLSMRTMDSRKIISETTAFSSVPHGHQALKEAQDRLFVEFHDIWRNHRSEQEVFDAILDFIQVCDDTMELMKSSEGKLLTMNLVHEDKRWLEVEGERNSWRLIFALYQDRVGSMMEDEEMDEEIDFESKSEKEIMTKLYKTDHTVRECQLVIDWLEQNASDVSERLVLEQFTDKTIAWENTLHQVQNNSIIPYKSSREIVTRLDPDAPRRQHKPLHDLDKEDEDRLSQKIFSKIRCGHLDEAQSLCVHAGHSWRAAVLEGWRLYHDPNYKNAANNAVLREPLPVEGNPNRDLWKVCAWRLCNDNRVPVKMRAPVAAYCGHLPTLLSVSTTWEDHLWSYLKTFVDMRVEKEIRENNFRSYVELPGDYWNNLLTVEDVFNELAASKDPQVKRDSHNLDRQVHKYLILDQITQLMKDISNWIQGSDMSVGNEVECLSPHFLRFLTHLVLFLRRIGRSECENIGDAVIEAYVKLLIEYKDSTLVAWYVSQLPQDDQIYYYSSFLEEIRDPDERENCLKAAQDAGLNIDLITKTVVENIRRQPSGGDNMTDDLQLDVTSEDTAKISALDWLLYHPKHRLELLVQTNALVATFLINGNIQAARLAFNKVPDNSIDMVMSSYLSQRSIEDTYLNMMIDNVPREVSVTTKEYLCYKSYLDADDSFSDWFQHFHHAKPTPPVLKSGATFADKVSYEHKNNQYKIDCERWKLAMENQTKTTKALLLNILTFPRGWLVDDEDVNDTDRNLQLSAIRSVIIPKVSMLLHTVMHNMGDYTGCVALADIIASHQYQLTNVFSKYNLQGLLTKICESSVALMNEKKDSWGFSLA